MSWKSAPRLFVTSVFILLTVFQNIQALSFAVTLLHRKATANIVSRIMTSSSADDATNNISRMSPSQAAVEYARIIGRLKTTPRTGWVRRGVPRYESVADHSWRVAALSLLMAGRSDIDLSKLTTMALIHDIGESIVGDIPPEDNVSKDDKNRMEEEAVQTIANILRCATTTNDNPAHGADTLVSLFQEHERRETKVAESVKDLDLLDMIIQADEYERKFSVDLSEFFESTPVDSFRDPMLRKVADEIHTQRHNRRQMTQLTPPGGFLSGSDQSFIEEYGKATNIKHEDIENIVMALRKWESKI